MLIQKSTEMDMPLFHFYLGGGGGGLRQASENMEDAMQKQIRRIHSIFCQPGP